MSKPKPPQTDDDQQRRERVDRLLGLSPAMPTGAAPLFDYDQATAIALGGQKTIAQIRP